MSEKIVEERVESKDVTWPQKARNASLMAPNPFKRPFCCLIRKVSPVNLQACAKERCPGHSLLFEVKHAQFLAGKKQVSVCMVHGVLTARHEQTQAAEGSQPVFEADPCTTQRSSNNKTHLLQEEATFPIQLQEKREAVLSTHALTPQLCPTNSAQASAALLRD